VDKEREDLIATIEGKLSQTPTMQLLFAVRWRLD
jgi:hypothetical protein